MRIELDAFSAERLGRLLDSAKLGTVPVIVQNGGMMEADAPGAIAMLDGEAITKVAKAKKAKPKQAKIKASDLVFDIDDSIFSELPKVVQEFEQSKYWYHTFSKTVTNILGSSEGTLFLVIMAVTSAKNALATNLLSAFKIYQALMDDMKQNPQLLQEYFDFIDSVRSQISTSNAEDRAAVKLAKSQPGYRAPRKPKGKPEPSNDGAIKKVVRTYMESNPDSKYNQLRFNKFITGGAQTDSHILGAISVAKEYINNGGKLTREYIVQKISDGINRKSEIGALKADRYLGGHKIMNFALNLLDPNMQVSDLNYFPVTIDTWMIYFFYPQTRDSVALKTAYQSKVFSNTGGVYLKLANVIAEKAALFNLKPHELQAIIWVATYTKYEPNAKSKDMVGAMKQVQINLNKQQEEYKAELQLLEQMSKGITR